MNKPSNKAIILTFVICLLLTSCGSESGSDDEFSRIYDNGYDDGYDYGYDKGYEIGYSEGYEEGNYSGYEEAYNEYSSGAIYVDPYQLGYVYGNLDGFYLDEYIKDASKDRRFYSIDEDLLEYFNEGYLDGYSDGYDTCVEIIKENKKNFSIKDIPLIPVQSTAINNVGYDYDEMILLIEFTQGELYQYFDVDWHEMEYILSAESPGQYVNSHIKGTYEYKKVD